MIQLRIGKYEIGKIRKMWKSKIIIKNQDEGRLWGCTPAPSWRFEAIKSPPAMAKVKIRGSRKIKKYYSSEVWNR